MVMPAASRKTFAEFFAGIGLVHLGLRTGSWQCVYANDIEPKKHQMYVGHFGAAPYYHVEDIWNADRVLERLNSRPFMATASFPCIDLSQAGHWRGFDGEHSSTYFGFVEILRRMGDCPPKVVMLENVYGFLTSRDGNDFRRAVSELADLGYWIDVIVLDAKWFVPQSRPRAFVFGFHESLASPLLIRNSRCWTLDDPWANAIADSGQLRPPTLRDLLERVVLSTGWATVGMSVPKPQSMALSDLIDLDAEQSWWPEDVVDRHYKMMQAPSRQRVDAFIQQRKTAVGAAFRRTRRGKTRCEVRFDMAGCLRTPKGGSAKQIVVAVADGRLRMRWMSAREYARLQGAGDFRFSVPQLQAMYGFGDAVCVPAIEWIDRHILTPVYDSHRVVEAAAAS